MLCFGELNLNFVDKQLFLVNRIKCYLAVFAVKMPFFLGLSID